LIARAPLSSLLAALLLAAAAPARATFVNGSFETGDTSGWSTTGAVSVVDATFGVTPSDGSMQILVSTGSGAVDAATLESAMGLGAGFLLDRLPEIFPKTKGTTVPEGSAFQQTIVADPGDVIEFDWNFLTDEVLPEQTRSDFLFYDVSGVETGVLSHARLQPDDFLPSASIFTSESGYQTAQIAIPSGSTPGASYVVTVGVADVEELFGDSGAVIDGFRLQKAPEPGSFGLLAGGLLALAWRARRR
jgi:hypothetical protein